MHKPGAVEQHVRLGALNPGCNAGIIARIKFENLNIFVIFLTDRGEGCHIYVRGKYFGPLCRQSKHGGSANSLRRRCHEDIFPFKSLCHTLTNPFSPKGLSFHIYFLSLPLQAL